MKNSSNHYNTLEQATAAVVPVVWLHTLYSHYYLNSSVKDSEGIYGM